MGSSFTDSTARADDIEVVRNQTRMRTLEDVSDWVKGAQDRITFEERRFRGVTRLLIALSITAVSISFLSVLYRNVIEKEKIDRREDVVLSKVSETKDQMRALDQQLSELRNQVARFPAAQDAEDVSELVKFWKTNRNDLQSGVAQRVELERKLQKLEVQVGALQAAVAKMDSSLRLNPNVGMTEAVHSAPPSNSKDARGH